MEVILVGYLVLLRLFLFFVGLILITKKKRKEDLERQNKEYLTRQRLSIKPFLQTTYAIVQNLNDLDGKSNSNKRYVDLSSKQYNVKEQCPLFIKRIWETKKGEFFSDYYIFVYKISNNGAGTAIDLNMAVGDNGVLFHDSLVVGQWIDIYFILDVENIRDKHLEILFTYNDVAGIGYYEQKQELVLGSSLNDIILENRIALSKPHIIQTGNLDE